MTNHTISKNELLKLLKDKDVRKELRKIIKPTAHITKLIGVSKALEVQPHGGFVNEKELFILRFVFKWKVATFPLISAALGGNEVEDTIRRRVNRLIERGFLKRIDYLGQLHFIHLTEYGFARMKNGLDGIKEDGFASEALWHDYLTVALQLGRLATYKSQKIEIVTEQEMRRYFKTDLPYWVPNIDSHRPDGFTKFVTGENQNRIIAYEVEISTKTPERYDSVAQYYTKLQQVELVVWLVKSVNAVEIIQRALARHKEVRMNRHCFILLDDFINNFWDAKTYNGQQPPNSFVHVLSASCPTDVLSLSAPCPDNLVSDFLSNLAKGRNHYKKMQNRK